MPAFHGRVTAKIEGDFVVFLIGMRFNRLLSLHKCLPVFLAFPRMLRELRQHPELGMLHAETFRRGRTILSVQYWRSFDQLHAYAHAKDGLHLTAWSDFKRKVAANGAVGIFHESYLVRAGAYECVYVNMPEMGLARAGQVIPATGRMESARGRLKAGEPDRANVG
jgi:hypothetical protein